ncbi:MAG: glutamyl-tRNA reductase [Planctomycetes bacterium]|nr:glutamyl-tRNA reductase [Planctomycetota bacterium]
MKLQMVGCSHHGSSLEVRERLAFTAEQARDALRRFRCQFPRSEAVLLSTCNRVELYTASEAEDGCPTHQQVVEFLARYHGLEPAEIFDDLFERTGEDAVRHLFTVAASLDSMVVGEAQILSQVKQAYDLAADGDAAGALTHIAFQAAIRVARRVARETAIHQKRVSIASVAVADFALSVFDRFDDKKVLVIGAGEMGQETLAYLQAEGAREITVVNRNLMRAERLARQFQGRAAAWDSLLEHMAEADLVVGATGARGTVVSLADYRKIEKRREQRNLLILDLAVPRDFDPAIGDCIGVYLFAIDDLRKVCEENRKAREKEWPAAERIIEEETARFMAEWRHRATGPTIRRLRERSEEIKQEELSRVLNKLTELDDRSQREITLAFDRLVNKLLHPPLKSLRDEAEQGAPHGLLDALKRLFHLKD